MGQTDGRRDISGKIVSRSECSSNVLLELLKLQIIWKMSSGMRCIPSSFVLTYISPYLIYVCVLYVI